jgi:hypothetical protein
MREIAYDIPKYWPMVMPNNQAWGILKNEGTGLCPNSRNSKQVNYNDEFYDSKSSEEQLNFIQNLYQENLFDSLLVFFGGRFRWSKELYLTVLKFGRIYQIFIEYFSSIFSLGM